MSKLKATKIVATLGPSTRNAADVLALAEAGVNVFRLNFSHGSHQDHATRLQWIRQAEVELGQPLAALMDLQGPKLRIGTFKDGKVDLEKGQLLRLDLDPSPGDQQRVCLPHPEILAALRPGMQLLLDDGKIRLQVIDANPESAITEVQNPAELSDRKGVNVPEALLELSPLTSKDRADLDFGLQIGVDWVALSFVQRPEDMREARQIIGERAFLLAKIEKPSAITELDAIIELSDAVMVARGDLGVELPAETLPRLQKRIIQRCRLQGKPVVVATQMLESMRFSPAPTRAEVTDVANAVFEGADAVMLSAETASGHYPLEAVQMMSKVIRQVESDPAYRTQLDAQHPGAEPTSADAISCAIRRIARILPLSALVNFSSSGSTSLRAARERPQVPILSLTPNLRTARRLALAWGVYSLHQPSYAEVSNLADTAKQAVQQLSLGQAGDSIVITAGIPFGQPGTTNMLQIEQLEPTTP